VAQKYSESQEFLDYFILRNKHNCANIRFPASVST